jgi:RNA polymerase sigma factor, sigma-70 family
MRNSYTRLLPFFVKIVTLRNKCYLFSICAKVYTYFPRPLGRTTYNKIIYLEKTMDLTFRIMLAQAKRGAPEALAYLYFIFHDHVYKQVSSRVPIDDAEDVVQDVFVSMVREIRTIHTEDEMGLRAWLNAITWTAIATYHRKNHYKPSHAAVTERIQFVPLEEACDVISPDDPTQRIETIECNTTLYNAMKERLSTDQHQVVLGRYAYDESVIDLANRLGKGEQAIYEDQYRGLKKLRKDPDVKQVWAMRILVALLGVAIGISFCVVYIGRTQPGDPCYSIKQMFSGGTEDKPVPRYKPRAMPTRAPTPTIQPSPSPSPESSPTNMATTANPASTGSRDGILSSVATALPIQSSDGTPVVCVIRTCVNSPLP